jgi:hypothetical protein
VISQRLGGHAGAQALASATAATAGRAARHRMERTIVHDGVARDVPFLGAALKKVPTSFVPFLQAAGRRVFFGVARTITYVARKFPRSFDVLRLQGVKYSTCRYAQRFEWQVRVGLTAVSGIGGETRDAVLRWRGTVPPTRMYNDQVARAVGGAQALHKVCHSAAGGRVGRGKARKAWRAARMADG